VGPRPPDLEDLLRRGQDRLQQLLPGGYFSGMGILLVLAGALGIWGLSGFFRVQSEELGVVLRFGKHVRTVQPGLNYHLPYPIETVLLPKALRVSTISIGMTLIEDPARRIAIAIRKFIDMSRRRPDWGGLLVRMIPLAGGAVSAEMRRGVLYDLKAGLKSGRFHFPSMQAAVALSMGTITLAIRATIKESTPAAFPVMIATMILQGLGMSSSEAARVAARPLPIPEVTKITKPRMP